MNRKKAGTSYCFNRDASDKRALFIAITCDGETDAYFAVPIQCIIFKFHTKTFQLAKVIALSCRFKKGRNRSSAVVAQHVLSLLVLLTILQARASGIRSPHALHRHHTGNACLCTWGSTLI